VILPESRRIDCILWGMNEHVRKATGSSRHFASRDVLTFSYFESKAVHHELKLCPKPFPRYTNFSTLLQDQYNKQFIFPKQQSLMYVLGTIYLEIESIRVASLSSFVIEKLQKVAKMMEKCEILSPSCHHIYT
jgi:hypothetical protein